MGESETVKALGRDAVAAVFALKRTLRDKEPKLAGYVRHGVKNHMGAMTTSPTEGQNVHIRHGQDKIGVKYQAHKAMRRLLNRIQRNLSLRQQRAHAELARNTLFSNAWTRDYLIRKGQALLDRNHAKRLHIKSARLAGDEFIMWNFDIGDWLDLPHPLYQVIPNFLRICKIKLVTENSGANYSKCTCGEREGVGVPCTGFFKMCDDAGVANNEMVHPCMVDVRYLKLYHTHYGAKNELGALMLKGQKYSFSNERKGTGLPKELMHLLLSSTAGTNYPALGKHTSNADLLEASFVLDRETTTVMDIERLRSGNSTEDYEDGPWSELGLQDDLHSRENFSQSSDSLKQRIASSMEDRDDTSDEQKRIVRPNEEEKDNFFRKWNQFLIELGNDSRTTVRKMECADDMMESMKDELRAMTLEDFPPSKPQSVDHGPTMAGDYGDNSPQKVRKRGSGGL